mgnify:CR=1 FL=1
MSDVIKYEHCSDYESEKSKIILHWDVNDQLGESYDLVSNYSSKLTCVMKVKLTETNPDDMGLENICLPDSVCDLYKNNQTDMYGNVYVCGLDESS